MPAWNAHWISLSIDPREDLGVFGFRRRFTLDAKPAQLKVKVSADQRYKLYVNGQFVGFGPQRGDLLHWFYETHDLAPFLRAGENWIAALVWNFGRWAPMAQHSARTGFVLEPLDARHALLATPEGWEVARLDNWSFDMMHAEDMNFYIDVGPGEKIDFRGAPWGWRTGEDAPSLADWRPAYSVCRAEDRGSKGGMTPWSLIPRTLPPMLYVERPIPPKVRRGCLGDSDSSDPSDRSELSDALLLEPGRPYLFDYEELLTAYPRLEIEGPSGAEVVLTYAEALWQEDGAKGNRNDVAGKKMSGYQDRIVLDGERRTIETLWWRTYRYVMVEVVSPISFFRLTEEEGEGVVLHRLSAIETGYPLKEESSFEADDLWVKPIWDVAVRTAKRCAGETYFDCPYYEQLQYVGDTRIQALIGYYLGRDRSLTRNAVETLGWSLMENGLTQSRYPSRQPQIIPPFSLWWVMMLWDQVMYDRDPSQQWVDAADQVIKAFRYNMNPGDFWNFVDWVPNWSWGVPPDHTNILRYQRVLAAMSNPSSTIAFHDMSEDELEKLSDSVQEFIEVFQASSEKLLRSTGQEPKPKTLADLDFLGARTDEDIPTEHAEALCRLCSMGNEVEPLPWPTDALANANAAKCTYYFSYYKHLAKFGREDIDKTYRSYKTYPEGQEPQTFDYLAELQPWKEMIENGLSTFAENPEPTRSDCHAWSAHPILGFFQIVAGVTSVAPGWKKARIDPRPGNLKRFKANISHPEGRLVVSYEKERFEIDSPVDFEMRWKGKREELKAGKHQVG